MGRPDARCCAGWDRSAVAQRWSWIAPTRETGPAAWPELGYDPVVPPKSNRRQPWDYDAVYRKRNEIERFFCRLKRFRRIATRYDKLDVIFLSLIYLALIYDALQSM